MTPSAVDLTHVDPGTISVGRWQGSIAAAVVTLMAAVALNSAPLHGLPGAALFAIVGFGLAWFWPALSYRHLRYSVDPNGISIERGVIWRSNIALPRVRIQHTDVSQGPLQRRYGVATLTFYTAGSRHTEIHLPGLSHEDALALRDALLAGGSGSGV